MAWIESHQRLKCDPKLARLRRRLGITRRDAIGLLHELWWYALEHAETGDLNSIDHRDIAIEVDWPEDEAERLWDALIEKGPPTPEYEAGEPGFLEIDGNIHNWRNFAGRLLNDRERKRASRAAERDKKGLLDKHKKQIQGPSADSLGKSAGNRTVPYRTLPTETDMPENQGKATEKSDQIKESFLVFYGEYPRKIDKKIALRSWNKINPSLKLFDAIMAGLKDWKASDEWIKDDGKYVPYPATWLNRARWESPPKPSSNGSKKNAGAAAPVSGKYAKQGASGG